MRLIDALRVAVVLFYAVNLMVAIWVVQVYYEAYRKQTDGWQGLLPHHVWVIGLSYITYGGVATAWSVSHLGDSFSLEVVGNVFAGLAGVYGMKLILAFEQQRTRG